MTAVHRLAGPALRHLRRADPVMAGLIDRVGRRPPPPRRGGTHFDALVRAIVYQQLSGKAAATILARVCDLVGGRSPSAAEIMATSDERLRGAGLSRQKIGYLRDLAAKATSGEVPFARLGRLDDDGVIAALVRIKGVGVWSAQMFLLFRLGRPDVLPTGDLGIQNAVQRAYRLRRRPGPDRIERIGAPWRPYASFAAWYLWRSLDVVVPD